ncbi:MAG: glycosyltransferase family 4 protein [Clostridiales bacterium]|nr:glycosyltransferase family 4 protein [Clostridiales bacterium]
MGKAAFSMFACDSAAEEIQRIYGLKEKPVVVRNIPNYWHIDENECRSKRSELCRMMDVPDNTFIAIYHGLISNGRGIENIIESIAMTTNTALIILGFGDKGYIDELKKICREQNVDQRVLFLEAVPLEVLYKYLGAADVGMITIPAVTKSYYYMLPNKFFENIQSLTPVICSAFPEVSRIVNHYDIGLLVDPENTDEIARAIMKLQNDNELYKRLKDNLKQAKEDLCWENEQEVLKNAYSKILQ